MARWNGKTISSRRHSLMSTPGIFRSSHGRNNRDVEFSPPKPRLTAEPHQVAALRRTGTMVNRQTLTGHNLTWTPSSRWWHKGLRPVICERQTYPEAVDAVYREWTAQARNVR